MILLPMFLEDFAAIKSPKILIGGGNIATSMSKNDKISCAADRR
jgi:hypothetical protein